MNITNSNILVIGGAGFVGSNLVEMLLNDQTNKILVIDNLLSSEKQNIPNSSNVKFWEGSITDDKILNEIQDCYDYIFHLATFHGNQNSIFDPIADHENNTLTTLKLYQRLAKFNNIKSIVYSSAGCSVAHKTFDSPDATDENASINLIQDSPYSISKVIGEFYSVYYHRAHSLPIVRARFQNVYGPREILGAGKWRGTAATIWRNVTPNFIYKALNGEALPLENGGVATRDFIYVSDICRGLISCATSGKPGNVYNIASGKEISILDLANTINRLTNNPTPLDYKPKRDWDNSGRRYGSTAKAKEELGFVAEVEFETGLKRTIEWTKNNLDYISSVINKHSNYN